MESGGFSVDILNEPNVFLGQDPFRRQAIRVLTRLERVLYQVLIGVLIVPDSFRCVEVRCLFQFLYSLLQHCALGMVGQSLQACCEPSIVVTFG